MSLTKSDSRIYSEAEKHQLFHQAFFENALELLWQQWGQLGVGGQPFKKGNAWIIDPEALCLLLWSIGRFEPRLYDEVLRWSCYWSKDIDTSRLTALTKMYSEQEEKQVAAAFADTVSLHCNQKQRWKSLTNLGQERSETETFFLQLQDKHIPFFGLPDLHFQKYGFLRSHFHLRENPIVELKTQETTHIRLLLKRFFGTGVRAEAVLVLLTHEQPTPKEISLYSGYTQRSALHTLQELLSTGMISAYELPGQKRRYPARVYTLQKERWWLFLQGKSTQLEVNWIDWIQISLSVIKVLRVLKDIRLRETSQYQSRSLLRKAMKEAREHIMQTALRQVPFPDFQVQDCDFYDKLASYWQKIFRELFIE